ncbi:hypothetical protein L9F63_019334, partial [Diploptera punctata]
GGESYEKTSGHADNKGPDYEIYMSMLLFIRSKQRAKCFKLATNMVGTGAFDDIILWFNDKQSLDEKLYLLQLKHKANKSVTEGDLCSSEGKLSLMKYFCSYLEVMRNFPNDTKEFIIYTNAQIPILTDLSTETCKFISSEGRIVTIPKNSVVYKNVFKCVEDYLTALEDVEKHFRAPCDVLRGNIDYIKNRLKCFKYLPTCRRLLKLTQNIIEFEEELRKQISEWNSESWDVFINSLKLYIEQPSLERLENLINEELEEYCGTSKMYLKFKEGMKDWWSSKSGHFLTEKFAPFWEVIIKDLEVELTSAMINKMDLVSELNFHNIQDISCTGKVLHVICSGSSELSCLKVKQSLANIKHLLIDGNILRQRLKEVMFVWKNCEALIVDSSLHEDSGRSTDEVIAEVSKMLHNNPEKKIVFVSDDGDCFIEKLKSSFHVESYIDKFNLSQMTDTSQQTIMNFKVEFQGQPMELGNFIRNPEVVTSDVIIDLLRKKNIEVGCKLPKETDIYIPRIMERCEIVFEDIIFNVPETDCIAFSGISVSELRNILPHDTIICQFSELTEINKECNHFILEKNSLFSRFCQQYKDKNVHWIEKSENSLIWKQSNGDIKFLIDYLNKNSKPKTYTNILNLLNNGMSSDLVLLTAEPGMGKTIELTHWAQVLKEENHAMWVILVNLNDHTNILTRENITALELLYAAGNITTDFGRSIFKHEFDQGGKIVILFDGFDEICPDYKDKVIRIVNEISSKNINICLTSRTNLQSTLESQLCTLALSLRPFTKNDQITFMRQFWKINNTEKETIFAEKVLKLTAKCLKYEDFTFSSISLHTYMLAVIFDPSCNISLPDHLDILQLYKDFIDIKCQVFFEKERSDQSNLHFKEMSRKMRDTLQQDHEIYAIVAFFTKEDFDRLSNSRNLKKRYNELVETFKNGHEKTGLIVSIANDKPTFVHRTFMEFFVAHWLSKNYESNREFVVNKLFNIEWQTVRAFFDRILCAEFKFHAAILNQSFSTIEILLRSGEIDVNNTDEGGRTPLHLAILQQYSEEQGIQQKILNMLLDYNANLSVKDDVCKWRPLQIAETLESWFVVEILLERGADRNDLVLSKKKINDHEFGTFLVFLFKNGMKNIVNFMLHCGLDVNYMLVSYYYKGIFHMHSTLLHAAASMGQIDLVRLLVEKGGGLEIENREKRTPVMVACLTGNFEVVKFLKAHGAQMNVIDTHQNTALILASQSGNVQLVSFLVQSGLDVNTRNELGQNALLEAAEHKNWDIVRFLISSGADITSFNKVHNDSIDPHKNYGKTVLHFASEHDVEDIIVDILNTEININVKDGNMMTPVLTAATSKKWEVVKLLLKEGADHLATDISGNTLLHYAAEYGATDIISILLGYKMDINIRNKYLQTPTLRAASYSEWETVEQLLEHGADYTARDNKGNTIKQYITAERLGRDIFNHLPVGKNINDIINNVLTSADKANFYKNLETATNSVECGADYKASDDGGNTLLHYAAEQDAATIIKQLPDLGESVNVTNRDMETSAQMAGKMGNSESMKLLLERGVDRITSNGNTLLHYAAECETVEIVAQLLDAGINVDITNKSMQTPAHRAVLKGRLDIVKFLLEHGANASACDICGKSLIYYAVFESTLDLPKLNYGNIHYYTDVFTHNSKNRTSKTINWDIVKLLIEHGADKMTSDRDGNTLLHCAANHSGIDIINQLLDAGIYVDVRNSKEQTPLHLSLYNGKCAVMKYLVENGADLKACDNEGNTLLHSAAKHSGIDTIKYLLDSGMNINDTNKKNQTVAHLAVHHEKCEVFKYLVDNGADLRLCDNEGNTLLHSAAKHGSIDTIKYLLDSGMNVNDTNRKMQTAAYLACYHDKCEVFKYLVDNGADLRLCDDNNGNTLLHYAAMCGSIDIIKYLLDSGMNINGTNKLMQTAAYFTLYYDKCEALKYLVENGADLRICDKKGNTLLHCAALCGSIDIIKYLLDSGMNINGTNKDMQTAAYLALDLENCEVLKYLVDNGADLRHCDNEGNTLLHSAALCGRIHFIKYLLDSGMNINGTNKKMQTAAYFALDLDSCEALKYLVDNGADLRICDHEGNTLLHSAAKHGSIDTIKYLLDSGMNINDTNKEMQTAAYFTMCHGKCETLKYLVDNGADLRLCDNEGNTLLHSAAKHGSIDIIKYLLDSGLNINDTNKKMQTAAYFTMCHGKCEALKYLVDNGADLRLCDNEGNTLLHCAALYGSIDIIKYLLDSGMNINGTNKKMQTAAYFTMCHGKCEALKYLVENGADLRLCNNEGNTLLHYAALYRSIDIIKYLLDSGMNINGTNKKMQTAAYFTMCHGVRL